MKRVVEGRMGTGKTAEDKIFKDKVVKDKTIENDWQENGERVVLAGVDAGEEAGEFDNSMTELCDLAKACNMEPVGWSRRGWKPSTKACI